MNSHPANDDMPEWRWDGPSLGATAGLVLLTVIPVVQFIRAGPIFEQLFKELGVLVPLMTVLAQVPAVHVVVGLLLTVPLILRHRVAWTAGATTVWFVSLLLYAACCHVAFFEPLIQLVGQMGMSVGG